MATFPGAVKTFTARADGVDANAAADVNERGDEITAIEDGYLNGTARLNSSNSTCANLSVTGKSTLANLQAGGSTFTALVSASLDITASTFSVRPVMPPPEFGLVFMSDTGTVGSSALSTLAFKAQAILTNSSIHSTGTNPQRLTPQSTGLFQVSAQLQTFTPSSDVRAVAIVDSSNGTISQVAYTNSSNNLSMVTVGYKRFDALGGYVTCVFGGNGSSHSISSGVGITWFALQKL